MDRTNRSFKTSFLEKERKIEEMRGEEDDTRAQGGGRSKQARRLTWEQEQRIIFSDITTLEPCMEAYIVAMRAHLAVAAKRMASFNNFGGSKWCNW